MRFSFFFAGGKTEERGKIEEESSEGTKEFFFFEGGKKRLISRTNMRIAKEKESMLEWSEWNFASLSLFFLKSCFVRYSHEKFLLFKVKLSSSLAQRNIHHFCVSILFFFFRKPYYFQIWNLYTSIIRRDKKSSRYFTLLFSIAIKHRRKIGYRERDFNARQSKKVNDPRRILKGVWEERRRGQRSIGGD